LAFLIYSVQSDLFKIHRTVAGVHNNESFDDPKVVSDNFKCSLLRR